MAFRGSEKLNTNMYDVPEEESDSQAEEPKKNVSPHEYGKGGLLKEEDTFRLTDMDTTSGIRSGESGDGRFIQSSVPPSELGLEDNFNKNIRFNNDSSEVLKSPSNSIPVTVSFNHPASSNTSDSRNSKDTSWNTSEMTPALAGSNAFDGNNRNNISSTSGLPVSLPPLQTSTTEPVSPTATAPQVEPTVRRHFEVSNVDESALKMNSENDIQEKDENDTEPDFENKPLLEKTSSSHSDSDHSSTQNNYFDTIGPLENPVFLKMLNYSVSRVAQDDGFGRASNLDLDKFTGTEPASEMDSGWAWVVLFAAFFALSLTGATTFAAGILMPEILLKIDPDITKASWIGAVHISVLCMSGPFVGIVLNRFGAKSTVIFAGFVLSGGLMAASFCFTITQLILTHGLIAGLGSGFILNTMFVTVGQYFNRYRGLACGLLATGSGLGMLAGGNALAILLNTFGLKGTYLMWSGVTLHTLVFAMLLRPSPTEKQREAEKLARSKRRNFQGDARSLRSGTNSIYSARTNSFKRSQKYTGKSDQQDPSVAPLLRSVLHKDFYRSAQSVAASQAGKSHLKSNLSISVATPAAQSKLTSQLSIAADQQSLHAPSVTQSKDQADRPPLSPSDSNAGGEVSVVAASPTQSQAPADINRSFRRRLISGSSQAPSHYTSTGRLSYRPSIREQLQRNDIDNESLASTLVSHLQPQDALSPRYRLGSRSISSMFGSIASLPTALVIIKDDLSQIDTADGPKKKISDESSGLLNTFGPLQNRPFLVFITTCFLWALGDSPFSFYLPAYTISIGATSYQASSLYTAMGFGSMCGRFLSGLVASDSGIGPVLLHIGCLSVASLVVGLSPWFTSTYLEQMICAGLFGLYTGSLVPLASLITIELLGIGELGLGFGFLSMAQGIGYLAGPPLMGVVIQALGYKTGFRISGLILLIASFLAMMIAVLIKRVNGEEGIHDSFDDLEKALRRISDTDMEEGDEDIVSYQDMDPNTTSPTDSDTFQFTALKKKDEQASQEHALSGDGGRGNKLKEKAQTSPTSTGDLGLIGEER
ncbi:unnamed protein product [Candidula unifasciata]|uniref:Major facilitator superfamily (MFS) profile domain-containing protein n=1 Tax=Candidula unifasciata TaxID=100452 RepID=A0A8S3YPZ8_9EUPU|nr:unnamed protein product [Candidula unifasciata]